MKVKVLFYISLLLMSSALLAQQNDPNMEVVVIETDYGKIVIDPLPDHLLSHSNNFKNLAKQSFYDSTTFHRIAPGFVIQGGDPLSKDDDPSNDGQGGPDYTLPAEIGLPHLRGYIGAARMGDKVNPERRSNGSQFYICLNDLPQLDKLGYTIFAKVIEGMDVVDKIAALPVKDHKPLQKVVMNDVYVIRYKNLK